MRLCLSMRVSFWTLPFCELAVLFKIFYQHCMVLSSILMKNLRSNYLSKFASVVIDTDGYTYMYMHNLFTKDAN